MFLTSYYLIPILGVTDAEAQRRVVSGLASYRSRPGAYPLRVEFCELNYWTVTHRENITKTERGPGRLLQAINLR